MAAMSFPAVLVAAAAVAFATPTSAWADRSRPQDPRQVDGIAAVVNGEVISVGQVTRATALLRRRELDGLVGTCGTALDAPERPETSTDPGDRALACLIDATLVFREVRRVAQLHVRSDEVEEAYQQLTTELGSESALEEELRRYALTPEAVRRSLERQIMVARYIDRRFRASIEISERAARRHYDEVLVPDMESQGIAPPPFEQVADEYVRPILREREVNRRVQSWIADLHDRATIVRLRP